MSKRRLVQEAHKNGVASCDEAYIVVYVWCKKGKKLSSSVDMCTTRREKMEYATGGSCLPQIKTASQLSGGSCTRLMRALEWGEKSVLQQAFNLYDQSCNINIIIINSKQHFSTAVATATKIQGLVKKCKMCNLTAYAATFF